MNLKDTGPDNPWLRLLYALALTALSIFLINPYVFGLYDHWYMLAWVENLRHPELFSIDPVTAQRAYHYSVLYQLLRILPFEVHYNFVLMYSACLSAVFYLSMAIGRLFSKKLIYLVPLFIIVPWFTPGYTNTLPELLLMRLSGLPFLLAALYWWLRKNHFWGWTLAGVAFLFHPTTALYLAAAFGLHFLLDIERRKSPKNWWSVLTFVLLSLPVFYAKFTVGETGFHAFLADEYWLESIRTRSAHHAFPDTWPGWLLYSGTALLAVAVLAAFQAPDVQLKKFFKGLLLAVVIIIGAGLLFTYVWPSYLGIQVQPFRISRLLMLLTLLFVPVLFIQWPRNRWAVAGQILMTGLLYFGAYQQSKFHFFYYFSLSLPLWYSYYMPRYKSLAALFLIVTAGIVMDNRHFTPLQVKDRVPAGRQEMYSWIKSQTPVKSLWVIPSDMMYFRNRAERSVLVAWMDGTFGYFDWNYNRDWRQRYEALFGSLSEKKTEPQLDDWRALEPWVKDFDAVEVYVLKRQAVESPQLQEVWTGGEFHIYRYTP